MGASDDLPEIPPAVICQEIGHDWVAVYADDAGDEPEDATIVGRVCQRCGVS